MCQSKESYIGEHGAVHLRSVCSEGWGRRIVRFISHCKCQASQNYKVRSCLFEEVTLNTICTTSIYWKKKNLLGWHVNTCPYGLKKTTLEVLLYRAGKTAESATCLLCDGRPELRFPAPSWTWLYISVIPSIPTAGWEAEARKSLGAHVLARLAYAMAKNKRPCPK